MLLKFKDKILNKDCKITYYYNGTVNLEFELFEDEVVECEEVFTISGENKFIVKLVDGNIVSAELDFTDLKKDIFKGNINFDSQSLNDTLHQLVDKYGWQISNAQSINLRRTLKLEDESVISAIFKCAKIYNCTFSFDCINKIIKVINEPNKKDYIVSDNVNLLNFDVKTDTYEHYTRIYGYGKDGLSFSTVNSGVEYVENLEYNKNIISVIFRDDRFTDPQSLKEHCIELLKEHSKPLIEYNLNIIELENVNLKLHDEIIFLNKRTKKKEKHRIIEYVKYTNAPTKNEIKLINRSENLTTYLTTFKEEISQEITKEISKIDFSTRFDENLQRLNERFENLLINGYKVETENATYYVDRLPKESAVNVLKIGLGGIMGSSNGWNGNYELAISNNGEINASRILTGYLDADRLKANSITADKLTVSAKEELRDGLVNVEKFNELKVDNDILRSSISSINTRIDNLNNNFVYNLIEGTKDFSGDWNYSYKYQNGGEYQGLSVKSISGAWFGIGKIFNVKRDKTYTFSIFVKREMEGNVFLYINNKNSNVRLSANTKTFRVGTEFERIAFTFKALEDGEIFPRIEKAETNIKMFVCGYCLCEGTNTNWIPHIKEIQEKFDTAEIERNISTITQRQDSITQEVTEVKEGIKSFKVGTVNLLNGTNTFSGELWKNKSNWNVESESFKNFTVLSRQESKGGIYQEYRVKNGEVYTFSGFVKRETLGDVKINLVLDSNNIELDAIEKTFKNIGNEFQRISLTFKVLEDGLIQPRIEKLDSNGQLFICGLKLESGTVGTDWTPSIDDAQDNEAITKNYILNMLSDLDRIQKEFNKLKTENANLKTVISTELKQTMDSFEFVFNNFKSLYDENNNLIFEKINDYSRYIRFVNGNIEMGEVNSPLILKMKNNRIQFLQNGFEVAFFSNNALSVTETKVSHSITIGKFGFFPRENGNLSLRKVEN